MSTEESEPVDIKALVYQLQVQINGLTERVEQQGRNIDALVASLPKAGQTPAPTIRGGRTSSAGKVYREWVGWLQLNGPAYRQTIVDAVGKPLPGNQPVVEWTSIMATWPDTAVPSDTLCRINGISTGQGRPPTVYFLWLHRFDLHRLFGVGPSERPEIETAATETLLGVIHPPTESQSNEIVADEEEATPRFATMADWHERWDSLFDTLAIYNTSPDEEEKAEMVATLPEDTEGEPASVILARSFHEAKLRLSL